MTPKPNMNFIEFANGMGFDLHKWQKEVLNALAERDLYPIMPVIDKGNLFANVDTQMFFSMDFGAKDITTQTTVIDRDGKWLIMDIETLDNKLEGQKLNITIIDDIPEERESPSKIHAGNLIHHGKSATERLNQSKKAKQELLDKFWAARSKRG